VVGGERFGRYSFIGLPARIRIRARGTAIEVDDGGPSSSRHEGDPARLRRRIHAPLSRRAAPRAAALLRRARRLFRLRYGPPHRAETPGKGAALRPGPRRGSRIELLLTEELAVVDNLAGKIYLIVYADPGERDAYARARDRLQALRRKLR